MTNLVIQSFGRENEYRRAVFTIWSFYAWYSRETSSSQIILFTDSPEYFTDLLKDLSVKYVFLSAEKIRKMRGEIDFLHRMKIALIEEAFQISEGELLYADSDTFFSSDPAPFLEELLPERTFMHKREYDFESLGQMPLPAGIPFRAFLDLLHQKKFILADGSMIRIPASLSSWNAGVMLLHPAHARLLPDVYALTEQFYLPTHNHASEQYAFSVVLQNTTDLRPCDSMIFHYWYRVEKVIADQFLKDRIRPVWAALSAEQKKEDVKRWTKYLPGYFSRHVLMLRDQAIQAFNENKFRQGYAYAIRSLLKDPVNIKFIRDILYHTRRGSQQLLKKRTDLTQR